MRSIIRQISLYLILFTAICRVSAQTPPAPPAEQRLSIDVSNTDIQSVVRMISKGYNLNIILDKEITGNVTVRLTDVPVMEGLRTIAEASGLEVVAENNVYKIRKPTEEKKTIIRYADGKLTADIQNMNVKDFLKELSSKTSISIVPDSKVDGTISGKLYQVDFKDGLYALMEGNGYQVSQYKNIYQISSGAPDSRQPNNPGMMPRYGAPQRSTGSQFFVDYSNNKLSMDVSNGNLNDVIKAIAQKTDAAIVTYGNVDGEVNTKFENVALSEALALLLGGTRFTFVQKGNIILIGDRNTATPSGQALSTSELIHMKHIKADVVPQSLPKNIPEINIKVIKEQNALLVSGTSEDIVKTKEFLNSIDIPTPQVRIDAIIVEYKDNLQKEFGLNFSSGKKDQYVKLPAPSGDKDNPAPPFFEVGISADISNLIEQGLRGKLGIAATDLFTVLRFLESQDKAKILAQPSITTLNGYKATINVSETQYFKIVTGVAENYTIRYQPINFGIKLDITPWISKSGQITAEIAPEISNSDGINKESGTPNVSSRSITTTVRINDGQTLALGGLLKSQKGDFQYRIPFLGDLPFIGVLFRYSGTTNTKTNLVVYITPHILRPDESVNMDKELDEFNKSENGLFKDDFYQIKKISVKPDSVKSSVTPRDSVLPALKSPAIADTLKLNTLPVDSPSTIKPVPVTKEMAR